MEHEYSDVVCPECIEKLEEFGFICAAILDRVCANTLDRSITLYHDIHSHVIFKQTIKFLENKGYLLTCDIFDDFIAVVPAHFSAEIFVEEEGFCWCEWEL